MMRFTRSIVLVAMVLAGCTSTTAPRPLNAAFGQPFRLDGYNVTLNWLKHSEALSTNVSLPGTQLWILNISIENHTGSEQGIGTGFRLVDTNGEVHGANLLNVIGTTFSGTLIDGGNLTGNLAFSLDLPAKPVSVQVKPGPDQISVAVP